MNVLSMLSLFHRGKNMKEDDLIELMKERWTARKFSSEEISEEDLNKIIEAGRWSPSGGNKQPWELIIIRDEDKKQKIAELFAEGMGLSEPSERYTTPPVLIAVGIDTRVIESYPDMMPAEFVVYASIGAMVQNMSLVASSMGMVLSWGTQPIKVHDKLKDLLEVPDHIYVPDVLQLGYPDQEKHSSSRREKEQFTHDDQIDESNLREI